MLARFPALRRISILLVAALVAGCASHRPYRDAPVDNEDLEAYLSFLRDPGASRATVEARLGPPRSVFEGGRVTAYRLWEIWETVQVPGQYFWVPVTERRVRYSTACEFGSGPCETGMIQVMIEFGADGRVLRSATIKPY